MRVLLIDDLREIETVMPDFRIYPDFFGVAARTFKVGITELKNGGPWDILFLDHDLASFDKNGNEKTGYDVMCFLETHPEYLPKKIVLVTSNPVGRKRMQIVIDKIYGERP